jgi:hypothetical protein
MKNVTAAVFMALVFTTGVSAQYSYDFLDGFSLVFNDDNYTITDIFVTEAREDGIEIITPDGSSVYGFIYYTGDTIETDTKGQMLHEVRNLFKDELEGYGDETIHIMYDHTKHTDTEAYWIELTVDYGEQAFYVLGLDLSESPGTGEIMLFTFPPFFGLSIDEQYDILNELFDDIRVVFMEAAG